jgi:membrane protein involved in colicin uptake
VAKQQFPDLKTWLENLGLEKYVEVFEREEIVFSVLPDLTDADLERIGLPLGPRKTLLRAVAAMAREPGPQRGFSYGEKTDEAAHQEFGELTKLAEEKATLEATLARREAEYQKRETEAAARQEAEAKARAEADAKWEAEAKARAAAEEKARLDSIEKAKKEGQAELAKWEAEYQSREADAKAKADAEVKARREMEERARKEAEVRAKVEAETRARREAEERARREADAKAQAEADAKAKKNAEELAKRLAEIAKRESELKARGAMAPRRKDPFVQIFIIFVVVGAGVIGAHYWSISRDEVRLVELTSALDAATKASQELNLARQRQEELRKKVDAARLAESDAQAKGDQAKLKELQEQTRKAEAEAQKQNELVKQREADAKKATDMAKAADAKKQTEATKAAERAVQEKATQEKAAQERAQSERLVTEKAAAEKAAAEKALAAKPPPVSVAAAAPREAGLPGRYAFRLLAVGSGLCGRIGIQEDIEIRPGSPQGISGRDFSDLRIQSTQDGSIVANLWGNSVGQSGTMDIKLAGRSTPTGFAGTYDSRGAQLVCTGQWTLVRKASKEAERTAAPEKAPPVSLAAIAPEGVLPGRYVFHIMTASGPGCDALGGQEDIEIRASSAQGISGRDFTNLRFQSTQDGSVAATARILARRTFGETKLAGRATATGYAGTYEWRPPTTGLACSGEWTLVRKGD